MKVHGKIHSVSLVSATLILFFLIFVSSTASAATITSSVVGTDYKYEDWGQYPVIDLFGEKYVSLLEENNQIWQSHVDKLAKLVIDDESSRNLMTGEILDLGHGYRLEVKQVDVDGQKVWLELDKDGEYVDDQIISTDSGDHVWTCKLDNIQGVNNVPVLKIHVNQVFQGAADSIVRIDGIWLIDYANAMTLQIGDRFGDYTLTKIINGTDSSDLGSLVFEYLVTITDLGTLPGKTESYARGINNNGQVVGFSGAGFGYYDAYAFLWQNGVMNDLGTLGRPNSHAYGINDKGQVVGYSYPDEGEAHAFLWQNGTITDLGTLYYDEYSIATGINDNGQIVGYEEDTMYECRDALIWQNGTITVLGTFGGYKTGAYGINDKGQVVGYSEMKPDEVELIFGSHAFLWQNGTMTDLGILYNSKYGNYSCAYGINNNGQVVGESCTQTGYNHAFLWQNGVMNDLGSLGGLESCAYGINDKGQIVGYSEIESGSIHAFLWQNGVMIDLGTLPGGSNSKAYGINEKGQIVGYSETETGDIHATLWTLPSSNTKPVANFSASPSSGYAPLTVNFTDQSTNSPTAWNWNFGDGSINSILQNPAHTYSTVGNYTVTLTASSAAGSSIVTGIVHVIPPEEFEDIVSEIEVSDNRLREASPDTVYKSSPYIDVGGENNVRWRDVIGLDLSEYNSDAKISNAVLSLYWYYPAGKTRPEDTIVEVYRPASAWNSNYASWNKRDKGIAWKNPGGEWYDKNGVAQGSTPYATLTIKGSNLPDNRYYELDVTDLVKEYVSGKYENTGFLIKARTESNNYIAFYSSDWTNENQKPKITVTEKVPVVTLNATLTSATDNRLREASPDTVYKSSPYIDVGGENSVRWRDVIGFDLSEYSSDVSIKNAALSLYWYYPEGKTRPEDTIVEVYRPASSLNSDYVSWNKRDKGIAWKNPGGDWYDKNGVLQGNVPYATLTLKGSNLPDNRYYELDVTDLVKEYVSGKYENTGFLIKARTESNNYIAFYSSDCGNEKQVPKLQLVYR
jgi:probable HAF family extracellular repeat protein